MKKQPKKKPAEPTTPTIPHDLGAAHIEGFKEEAEPSEFEKFDAVVKKVLSVSREELQRREKVWKEQRAAQRRGKS
jgi:hypothetical protein